MKPKTQTPKQQKIIKLILENLGKPKDTKSWGELMLLAGYSKSMSLNPYQVLESETIKDGIQDFLAKMKDKRKMAIIHLTKQKFKKSPPREIAYVIDILTKNIQLLSGGKTEANELVIKWK